MAARECHPQKHEEAQIIEVDCCCFFSLFPNSRSLNCQGSRSSEGKKTFLGISEPIQRQNPLPLQGIGWHQVEYKIDTRVFSSQ